MNEVIEIDIDKIKKTLNKNKLNFDNQFFYNNEVTSIEYLKKLINSLNNVNDSFNYYKEKMLFYIENIELISKNNIPDFKPFPSLNNNLKQNDDTIEEL